MAEEKGTKPDRDAVLKSIQRRRDIVVELIAAVSPAILDEEVLEKQLAVSQQNVLAALFRHGWTDPNKLVSYDLVEFLIDMDLWVRWRGGEPATFPYPRPDKSNRPGSLKMRQYQQEQLAKAKAAAEATEATEKAKETTQAVSAVPAPETTGMCQLP